MGKTNMTNKEWKRLWCTVLKFKHKKRKITTAHGKLTLEKSVVCTFNSDGPPSINPVNSSHGDQGPGSKAPPTTESVMNPMEYWHWRDAKPDFSHDDILDMVAWPLWFGTWELGCEDCILGIEGRPEYGGIGGASYPSHLTLMRLSGLMSLEDMLSCRHAFIYAQEATGLPPLLEIVCVCWGVLLIIIIHPEDVSRLCWTYLDKTETQKVIYKSLCIL